MDLHLSPIEQLLFDALGDGEPHDPKELFPLIDETADMTNLQAHLSNLRGKLRPIGEDILCQSFGRRKGYRRIRLLIPVPQESPRNTQSRVSP